MNNEYHLQVYKKLKDKLFVMNKRNRMLYYKSKSFSMNLSHLSKDFKFVNKLWNLPCSLGEINLNDQISEDMFDKFYETANYLNRESNRKSSHFGFNNQNVIFGFLNWTKKLGNKVESVKSPLFMVKSFIKKERGKNNPFILRFESFNFNINPFVIKAIKEEYGIDLPTNVEASINGVMSFFNHLDRHLAKFDKMVSINSRSDAFSDSVWTIDFSNVTVDDISFANDAIINNYDVAIDNDFHTMEDCVEEFNKLFTINPKPITNQSISNINFNNDFIVVPSDKTQNDAVNRARSGDNYIIQGPPGTGKSQTITNLIADSVARNKKVLFVCEKKAALNVVHDRLKDVGLDDMSVFINNSVKDKKPFIKSLKDTYDKTINYRYDHNIVEERKGLVSNLHKHIAYIKKYGNALSNDYLAQCVSNFKTDYERFIDVNSKYILNNFYINNKNAMRNSVYDSERKVIEHEAGKKRSHKSITNMIHYGAENLSVMLKPIYLMSVDAVHENLTVDNNYFDLVIFDEASQIKIEDSALISYYAKQMIVVGDEQQLAPTSFFQKKSETSNDIVVDNNNGHIMNLDLYANNLLHQASLVCDSVMLKYHYRSQNESLIGFSNDNFYNGELITVPSKSTSSGISFHHIENGVYSDRRNNEEAKYIAQQLRDILYSDSGNSIGIVAFSEAQQKEIQKEIDYLCETDFDFANKYNQQLDKEEPIFVKNLENVQGDERDIMIISICYGYNGQGKMRMNFGPVNKSEGGKRLNVVFSRSKKHMMIVSSIKHSDINSSNEGAMLLQKFLYHAENCNKVVKGKNIECDIVDSIERFFELHEVSYDKGIGNDIFNIDLAIHGDNGYKLGIVVDRLEYESNEQIVEKLFLKSNTLDNFGWNIKVVSVFDWIYNKEKVLDNILSEAV